MRFWLQSLQKCANISQKNIVAKINMVLKIASKFTRKSYRPITFAHSKQSKKHHWLHFRMNIFATFSTDSKSITNSAFFTSTLKCCQKNYCLLILALFANFEVKIAWSGSKKTKNVCCVCLRVHFCIHCLLVKLMFVTKVKITALPWTFICLLGLLQLCKSEKEEISLEMYM